MVLEITISQCSFILKIMSRNTFPEPQPDSTSYILCLFDHHSYMTQFQIKGGRLVQRSDIFYVSGKRYN